VTGQHDDRCVGGDFLDLGQGGVTVHTFHSDVQHHPILGFLLDQTDRLFTTGSDGGNGSPLGRTMVNSYLNRYEFDS
jgi:hypothetical protein